MSTPPTTAKAPRRKPMSYTFNGMEFTSVNALLNYLIGRQLLTVKERVLTCKYCGATLHPNFELNHYWINHKDKVQLK